MPTAANIYGAIAGLIAVAALIFYFGIPPGLKRKLERGALKTMGENKLSYTMKDQISKVPESDQKELKELKRGLGDVVGGASKNEVGDQAGELADTVTSPLTGR